MSGIAEVLLNLRLPGLRLRPRDEPTRHRAAALDSASRVASGTAPENVGGADVVVYLDARSRATTPRSCARREPRHPGHPARRDARRADAREVRRRVAGSHGKTTTTSLVATVLRQAGLDPTVVVGGKVARARLERAPRRRAICFVAEADESDGSFLQLTPTIAVITNIDRRAPRPLRQHERVQGRVRRSSPTASRSTGSPCSASTTRTCRRSCRASTGARRPTASLAGGLARDARCARERVGDALRGAARGELARRVRLPHARRAQRAERARRDRGGGRARGAVRRRAPRARELPRRAASLRGARASAAGQSRVVDDYGHHPAEIEATLDAARGASTGRLVVAFQPHRYTRTRDLFDELHARVQQRRRARAHRRLRRRRGQAAGRDAAAARRRRSARTATATCASRPISTACSRACWSWLRRATWW